MARGPQTDSRAPVCCECFPCVPRLICPLCTRPTIIPTGFPGFGPFVESFGIDEAVGAIETLTSPAALFHALGDLFELTGLDSFAEVFDFLQGATGAAAQAAKQTRNDAENDQTQRDLANGVCGVLVHANLYLLQLECQVSFYCNAVAPEAWGFGNICANIGECTDAMKDEITTFEAECGVTATDLSGSSSVRAGSSNPTNL